MSAMLTLNGAMLAIVTEAVEKQLRKGGVLSYQRECEHGWRGPVNGRPCGCQLEPVPIGRVVVDAAHPGDGSAWVLVRLRPLRWHSDRVDDEAQAVYLQVSTLDGSWVYADQGSWTSRLPFAAHANLQARLRREARRSA